MSLIVPGRPYNRRVSLGGIGTSRRNLRHSLMLCLLVGGAFVAATSPRLLAQRQVSNALLAATAHPPLPIEPSSYWLVPDLRSRAQTVSQPTDAAIRRLAQGAQLITKGNFVAGLPLVSSPELRSSPVANYARYYTGVAQLATAKHEDALMTFSQLSAQQLEGALKELVPLRLGDVSLALRKPELAEPVLAALTEGKLANPDDVWLQRARVEEMANHTEHALNAYRRLYYDYPLSAQSAIAPEAIARLQTPELTPPDLWERGLARAERLFNARRWADARAGFGLLSQAARGEDKNLVALRLAECDYYLNLRRASRDALRPLLESLEGTAQEAEARFFYLSAVRGLGDHETFVTLTRSLVEDHPQTPWAEEALNNLASHYVTLDEDEEADVAFRELIRLFPSGRFTERAAWKVGWWAYKSRRFAVTAETFDEAAARFPRADNRPAWLYWSGRSRDQLGDEVTANARYRLAIADYQNSYYGRLATRLLTARREPLLPATTVSTLPGSILSAVIPTTTVIRELSAAEMYDDALREVQYAQRVWGDTAQLQATSAWIRNQQGFTLSAEERFTAVRGAITTMRRAYPQFMAAGGETLPADVLRIIFPLDYWSLITKYADARSLDPYLLAALMAQESTFTAEIRSHANAYGLMQIMPATGRVYARKLGITPFSTRSLTKPETNVRIGTQYFKDLVDRFGGVHFALASYNAGEHRVVRWQAERPGFAQDEFIDDIPFPETQNYVKRILGTAEDYRRLYGGGLLDPNGRRARAD